MRLTIGKRLWIGFGTLLLALAGLGLYSYSSGTNNARVVEGLSDLSTDQVIMSGALSELLMARMKVKDFLLTNSEEDIQEYQQWRDKFSTSLDELRANIKSPRRVELLSKIETGWNRYDPGFREVIDTITTRNELIEEHVNTGMNEVLQSLLTLETAAEENGDTETFTALAHVINKYLIAKNEVQATLRMSDTEHFKRATNKLRIAIDEVDKAIATAGPDDAAALKTIKSDLSVAADGYEQIAGLVDRRHDIVYNTLDVIGPQIAQLGKDLMHTLEEDIHHDEQLVASSLDNSVRTTSFVTLGVMLVGVVFAVCIARSIQRPLAKILERVKDIAQGEGDLTQRVDESRSDELGELGKYFNLFIDKIHDVVADVASASHEVASAATEIAASAEEMSAAVNEVASQTAEASRKSDESGSSALQGGQVVERTIEMISAIDDAASSSNEAVSELGSRGQQIGEVIAVINDIADQTNLLALNAAIEAARAGEHGRGFAVVADEVRKLAERTTQATEEVSESIKAIQSGTAAAVDRMSAAKERVQEGSASASEAGHMLTQIVESAQDVAGMITQIASATDEVGSSVAQSADACGQLSSKAEQLQSLVAQFKVNSRSSSSSSARQFAG